MAPFGSIVRLRIIISPVVTDIGRAKRRHVRISPESISCVIKSFNCSKFHRYIRLSSNAYIHILFNHDLQIVFKDVKLIVVIA